MNALRSLAAKEFHHLLPLIFALLALDIVSVLEWFVANSPDEISWADVSLLLDPALAKVAAGLYIAIGIVTAYMLFPHERDRNTLQFLWGLPVARWRVYAVKLATGFAVLSGLLVIGHLLLWWMHTFSVNSVSATQFSWALWSRELAALIGLTAISLGYGALVACFRIIGILGFIVLLAAAQLLAYMDSSYAYLDIAELLTPEYRGTEILLDSKAWWVHSGIGLGCAVVAGFVWTRDAQPPADRKKIKRIGARIGNGVLVVVTLLIIVTYGTTRLGPDLTNPALTGAPANALETITTRYFEISHYAADRAQAQLLAKEADLRAEQVQQLLGTSVAESILADLTDSSSDHLGIAGWKKLRIGQQALYDPEQRSHVFVHETAHVVASAASDRRLQDHAAYTGFFSEGLAEWVSYEILGLETQRHALRLLAALAWQRFDLRFGDFLYAAEFRARFDDNLVYALGESWVSTLAEVCGDASPGNALRAMARPDAPQRLQGNGFWRETLQAAGCDLTAVNGRFALLLDGYRSQIADVPVLTGTIETQDERLRASLTLEGTAVDNRSYRVVVRLRDNPGVAAAATFSESAQLEPGQTISLELPAGMISGQRFQYQLGLEFVPGERPFFGPWIEAG